MQEINISYKKLYEFKKKDISSILEKDYSCKIDINENLIYISADPYNEFLVKNIILAFSRGFDLNTAKLLENENFYFSQINIKQAFGSKKRLMQVKARIIGKDGKAKKYIERITGVKMCVYGNTVSFIGNTDQIEEAEIAVNNIMNGFNHGSAYAKMQTQHRKNLFEKKLHYQSAV